MCIVVLNPGNKGINPQLIAQINNDDSVTEIAVITSASKLTTENFGGKLTATAPSLKALSPDKKWPNDCVINIAGSVEYISAELLSNITKYIETHPVCDLAVAASLEDKMSIYIYQAMGVIPLTLLPSWNDAYMRSDEYGSLNEEQQNRIYETFRKTKNAYSDWFFVRYILQPNQEVKKLCTGWKASRSLDIIENKPYQTHLVGNCICSTINFYD